MKAETERTVATVGDRLRAACRRCFVGRSEHIELVRSALGAERPPFAVLFLHGPGGVGKTALLGALATAAESLGVRPVQLDMRTTDTTPSAFLERFGAVVGSEDADATPETLAGMGRLLVLIDAFESAAPLETWLRERFIQRLPSRSLVVIAGRVPPSQEWVTGLGWRDLLRVVSLRNLSPDEVRQYLELQGVDEVFRDRVLTLTHGHPLALSLVIDVLDQRARGVGGITDLVDAPDVVRMLMERFVDEIPDRRHREALAVCAHARFTTEDLLRAAMGGDDAQDLLTWLRSRSFVEEGRDGVFPHDLARDVLDSDLRWRDRVAYKDLHRRVRAHVVRQVPQSGWLDAQRAMADVVYLHRLNPVMRSHYDWSHLGQAHADQLRDDDRAAILSITERHQGAQQAAMVRHWLDRQPQAFLVFRQVERDVAGFTTILRLDEVSPIDIAADPGTAAMWAYATSHDPPRPGEMVTAVRFLVDRDANQGPSPSWAAGSIAHLLHALRTTGLAWNFLAPFQSLDHEPVFNYIDYYRVPEAEFEIGGQHHAVFAHDWRRVGPQAWRSMMGDRDLDRGPAEPELRSSPHPPLLVMSRTEFADAVRGALRDRHRPDRLDANPLMRSRVIRERFGAGAGAQQLAELLDEAVGELADDPHDAKWQRAIDRTYLRPAGTQERAAEVLDLPFSTYRRHLVRGVDRIVEQLWNVEINGRLIARPGRGRRPG